METDAAFREVQYFRQPWLLIVMAGIILLNIWGVVQQIVLGQPWGDNPASNELLLIIFLLSGILFPVFILSINLRVEVRKEGLVYRFFPMHLHDRTIAWQEITGHEMVNYHPLRDFGGWGIRYGKLGKAYSVSGDQGVLLVLDDGQKLVIGSRDANGLDLAISSTAPRPYLPPTAQ